MSILAAVSAADRPHLIKRRDDIHPLSHLNDMPIRVIEPNDPLSPAMLEQRMDITDIKGCEATAEPFNVLFFKIEFPRIIWQYDPVGLNKRLPGVKRLQKDTALQGHIFSEVPDDLQAHHITIELQAVFHV